MRDGHYIVVSSTEVDNLPDKVNAKREQGYTPQAVPFAYGGFINQVMTKPDRKNNQPDFKAKPPKLN